MDIFPNIVFIQALGVNSEMVKFNWKPENYFYVENETENLYCLAIEEFVFNNMFVYFCKGLRQDLFSEDLLSISNNSSSLKTAPTFHLLNPTAQKNTAQT